MPPKNARYLRVYEAGLAIATLFFMFVVFLAGLEAALRGAIHYEYMKYAAYILFVNHPTLMTLAFGGFMLLESLTHVRGRRPTQHMKTQLYSMAFAFLAVALVAIHKAKLEKPHLTTWHAQLGVLTLGLAVATTAVGSIMMLLWKLKVTVRPAFMRNGVLRRLHLRMAAVTQTAAGATILLGVQSNYFRNSLSLFRFGDTVPAQLLVSLMSIFPTGSFLYYLWLRKQAALKDE
ncbi:transmembrane reductase CYB561D2-like [Haemaphysalis longicornis]